MSTMSDQHISIRIWPESVFFSGELKKGEKKKKQLFAPKPGKGAKPAAVCGTNVPESHRAPTGSFSNKTVVVSIQIFT